MDDITWRPIRLLHVEYPTGDFVGYVLAWASMLPVFLFVCLVTLILFKRDLHTISFTAGILLDEVLNWVLKHAIKEHRPNRERNALQTEYGMPSNHSQFMSFFSTYLVIFLFIRVHHNTHAIDNLWKYVVSAGALCAACLTTYSRFYLGYHTQSQCWYGFGTGALSAMLWFGVVQLVFTPLFPVIVSWRISERFMLRDSTLIPNILWFEYTTHRSEARNRQRKQQGRKLS